MFANLHRALLAPIVAALSLASVPIHAQAYRPGGAVTDTNPQPIKLRCWTGLAWDDCGAGKQEAFQLVAANAPTAAQIVFGGDYALSQTCTSYGTLSLQVLGPDGSTWLTAVSKTAADTGSATGVVLGSYARVRVTLTGTAGCNAILARVPA